jgi:histidinol-phosphate/aromatic aminotransferase/cobyric acid decarboxylase-like protein
MTTKPETNGQPELSEELRARVPGWMKTAVTGVANERLLSDADILREAVAEYLERRRRLQADAKQLELLTAGGGQ